MEKFRVSLSDVLQNLRLQMCKLSFCTDEVGGLEN